MTAGTLGDRLLTVLRLRKPRPESVREVLADARKASEEMSEPVRHNPESPDADLRYTVAGPAGP